MTQFSKLPPAPREPITATDVDAFLEGIRQLQRELSLHMPPYETPEQRAKRELGFPIEGVEP